MILCFELLNFYCLLILELEIVLGQHKIRACYLWFFYGYYHILQKGPSVADTVIGEGNTTAWKMCGLDKSTCLTVMFDLSSSDRSNTPGTVNPQLYLQFLTRLCLGNFTNRISIYRYAFCALFTSTWCLEY